MRETRYEENRLTQEATEVMAQIQQVLREAEYYRHRGREQYMALQEKYRGLREQHTKLATDLMNVMDERHRQER